LNFGRLCILGQILRPTETRLFVAFLHPIQGPRKNKPGFRGAVPCREPSWGERGRLVPGGALKACARVYRAPVIGGTRIFLSSLTGLLLLQYNFN
jgi:hypothetical protein